jgi:phosphatidylglycerophosphate synthase
MHFKKEVNVPNTLTVIRLLLGPLIMYLILHKQSFPALVLFVLALLTDVADGFLARKYGAETIIGKHLDRWADKLLYAFVIFPTLINHGYHVWLGVFVAGSVAFLLSYKFVVRARLEVTRWGRLFVVLEAVLLVLFILDVVNHYLIGLFAIFLIIPAVGYIKKIKK